jgi:hypothetical protein
VTCCRTENGAAPIVAILTTNITVTAAALWQQVFFLIVEINMIFYHILGSSM